MFDLTGVAATLIGLILLSLASLGLVALCHLKGVVSNILAFAIIAYATIVLLTQVLSELYQVHRLGFLIGQTLVVLTILPFSFKLIPRFGLNYRFELKQGWKQAITTQPALWVLGLAVVVFMLVGAYLILVVPPNNYDSLWYHLTRVAYWLHNHTLHHFQTTDLVKTTHQGYNGEIGLLWLTALWGTDQLTGFVQWFATILTVIAIYGIGRQLAFSPPASLFAGLIWATFTIVVAQSTSTKNDLLVASFVTAAFYFLLAGLRETNPPNKANFILFGLSFGLAVGIKPLALMVGPGLVVMAGLLLLTKPSQYLPKLLQAGLWSVLGLMLVGSYNYTLNWASYHSFFGPSEISSTHLVNAPSTTSFGSNLARIGYHFLDPGGLPEPLVDAIQPWRAKLGQTIFSSFHIETNPSNTNFEDNVFEFNGTEQIVARDDGAWFGPLGLLLFLPILFYNLIIWPKDIWKWSTAFIAFSYLVIFALLVRWQPLMGRMLLVAVTPSAALMAAFYDWSEKYKLLRWAIVLIAGVVIGWSTMHNYHRPLLGSRSLWDLDDYSLRTFRKPYRAPLYCYIDATVPAEARLGVAGPLIDLRWTYPFFGPHLTRDVVELGPAPARIDANFFTEHDLDYLVFVSETPQAVESVAPLWPIIRDKEQWFLVKASEAEIFSETANSDRYHQVFGSDYTAYLEIKEALKSETEPVRVLTTDPRMPYYERDKRFVFKFTDDLASLQHFTHLVVAPWWSADDYERLGISVEDMQKFLSQDKFVKKIAETNGYVLYRLLIGNAPSQAISSDSQKSLSRSN